MKQIMQLNLSPELAREYTSGTQRARIVTEHWGERALYCANCSCDKLTSAARNTKAIDYICPGCDSTFQLKSQSHQFGSKIVDSAYSAMREAISSRRVPNIIALHYDAARWTVLDVVLIPHYVFSLSCIEKREPLGPNARRAGWVGCNILLCNIPEDARIPVVRNSRVSDRSLVREQFSRLRPLETLDSSQRGWTLDVLNLVRRLQKTEFALQELYNRSFELQRLHPKNHHVRDKIRQQLQVLRDLGILTFLGEGYYCIRQVSGH